MSPIHFELAEIEYGQWVCETFSRVSRNEKDNITVCVYRARAMIDRSGKIKLNRSDDFRALLQRLPFVSRPWLFPPNLGHMDCAESLPRAASHQMQA